LLDQWPQGLADPSSEGEQSLELGRGYAFHCAVWEESTPASTAGSPSVAKSDALFDFAADDIHTRIGDVGGGIIARLGGIPLAECNPEHPRPCRFSIRRGHRIYSIPTLLPSSTACVHQHGTPYLSDLARLSLVCQSLPGFAPSLVILSRLRRKLVVVLVGVAISASDTAPADLSKQMYSLDRSRGPS